MKISSKLVRRFCLYTLISWKWRRHTHSAMQNIVWTAVKQEGFAHTIISEMVRRSFFTWKKKRSIKTSAWWNIYNYYWTRNEMSLFPDIRIMKRACNKQVTSWNYTHFISLKWWRNFRKKHDSGTIYLSFIKYSLKTAFLLFLLKLTKNKSLK